MKQIFIVTGMRVWSVSSVMFDSLWLYELSPPRFLSPWDCPGKNTRVGCHALFQGIFQTQESNPHLLSLLHVRQILYPLSHLESSVIGMLQLSHFSRVWPCATHQGAHQAPLSLGFSRQEHWSGLPFPSPMCASEKWKWSRSVMSDWWRPHGLQPTRLLHPWDFPGKSTEVGCHCLLHCYRFRHKLIIIESCGQCYNRL